MVRGNAQLNPCPELQDDIWNALVVSNIMLHPVKGVFTSGNTVRINVLRCGKSFPKGSGMLGPERL